MRFVATIFEFTGCARALGIVNGLQLPILFASTWSLNLRKLKLLFGMHFLFTYKYRQLLFLLTCHLLLNGYGRQWTVNFNRNSCIKYWNNYPRTSFCNIILHGSIIDDPIGSILHFAHQFECALLYIIYITHTYTYYIHYYTYVRINSPVIWYFYLKRFPVILKFSGFTDLDVLFPNFNFAISCLCRLCLYIGRMGPQNPFLQYLILR